MMTILMVAIASLFIGAGSASFMGKEIDKAIKAGVVVK